MLKTLPLVLHVQRKEFIVLLWLEYHLSRISNDRCPSLAFLLVRIS